MQNLYFLIYLIFLILKVEFDFFIKLFEMPGILFCWNIILY